MKYCEYLKGNKCDCKEPKECNLSKLMGCPASTRLKIKLKNG